MKVSVINNDLSVFNDPIEGRPFSFNKDRCEFIEDHEKADFIFGYLDFMKCNEQYNEISRSDVFKKHSNKFVFMAMHDNPEFAYKDKSSIKFLSQPIYSEEKNKEYNVIPYPLQMRHFVLEITKDKNFIEELRNQKKIYNFVFIGNTDLSSRSFLKNIKLDNFYTRSRRSVWKMKNIEERLPVLKQFYIDMARSKFTFAPRGMGSSSFRLYEALMVGTVPIVFDMKDYPFKEYVDWDSFSIRGLKKNYDFNKLLDIDNYNEIRKNGMDFWDSYVDMRKCDRKLYDILNELY